MDLSHFVTAQDPVWPSVVAELSRGRKESHWMWFVFPQIAGLGRSGMAARYALPDLDAARAYLDHPVLGPRLREATGLALAATAPTAPTAQAIFGSTDAMKFRSSMTLFCRAGGGPHFHDALQRYFDGAEDPMTVERL